MKTYFTFGQAHEHRVNSKTFDKACVVEIEAPTHEEVRKKMMETFGQKWAFQYNDLESVGMDFYKRGIIQL